ncbi:hypothetical protein PISMIDRAFT_19772, partial [Pisolithus microcarpus 441]
MDPPSQGPPYSSVRQHLFHSSHLPPPSQLHLPPVSSSRSNIITTLPPLNPSNRMTPYRHSSSPSSWSTPLHRTSSSREDIPHSSLSIHQNTPAPAESRQFKREQLQQPPPPPPPPPPPQSAPSQSQKENDDNMPATSDFVKKLYKMLEDQSFSHVVSWGPNGDCFVVKDMNEFTKSILPRMFKHSNFASFVRQLNKYDFHKVKNTDDTQFGEHSWTFKHPDFHADRREALENIRRKVPAARKSAPSGSGIGPSTLGRSGSAGSPGPLGGELESLQAQTNTIASHTSALQNQNSSLQSQMSTLQSQTNALHAQNATLQSVTNGLQSSVSGFQSGMSGLQQQLAALQSQNDTLRTQLGRSEDRVRGLERCYKDVLGEMVHFQRNLAQQDALMQSLVQYFLRGEAVKHKDSGFVTSIAPGPAPPTSGHPNNCQQTQGPHTPAMPPPSMVASLVHSMTPSTHPPPSMFGVSPKMPTTAGALSASLLASQQPQPSPFLQPLTTSHSQHMLGSHGHGHGHGSHGPHGPPTTSSSSSALFRALSRSQAQAQAQAQVQAQTQSSSPSISQAQGQTQGPAEPPIQSIQPIPSLQEQISSMREPIPLSSQSMPTSMQPPMQESISSLPPGIPTMQQMISAIQTMQPMQQVQFLPVHEAHRVLGLVGDHRYPDPTAIARASLAQMNEMSRRAGAATTSDSDVTGAGAAGSGNGSSRGEEGTDMTSGGDAPFLIPPDTSWDGTVQAGHEGLQVFTLGHLLPRSALDDANGNWTYGGDMPGTLPNLNGGGGGDGNASTDEDGVGGVGIGECEGDGFEKEESPGAEEVVQPTPTNPGIRESSSSGTSATASSSSGGGQKLRVRRSTFVPGWAVPPRVLLVDDDAVSRRLSSKFLQVFGCAIDVAVDGVGAVNKMNLEKYDLVLMDIVMPKMDGISATSLIRQFDHVTPIISMTSNSRPSEIMTYYSSGMNDVLPKPFTKEGLLDMLEKHLMHLKVIQEMSRVPRMPCGSRLSTDNSLTDALVPASTSTSATTTTAPPTASSSPSASAANREGMDGVGGGGSEIRIDPLAGMGLTEERYQAILKDLVSGDNLSGVGVPEGFNFDMMGDDGIGISGVDVD